MKTKLGISAGLMGAALYFTLLFGGYTPFLILAIYILLKENDEWLRKTAVKAFAVSLCFSLAITVVNLIPDAVSVIDRLTNIFGKQFSISFISRIISFLTTAVSFIKTIAFLLLGLQALKMKDFPIAFIDKIVNSGVEAADAAVSKVTIEKSSDAEEK